MSKIFVAGAGGYIGMVLCRRLIELGHEVTAYDRYFFTRTPLGCEILRGDTRTVTPEILRGHDAAIDLAGLSNDASCEIDPKHTTSINAMGGRTMAWMAKEAEIKRYVYASSASVYGCGTTKALTESSPLNPLTAYAKSKVAVEQCLMALQTGAFSTVILRNATVFGVSPRMRFDLAVNAMTMRAWRDHVIYVMGGGEQWRPLVSIHDVVRAIVWALEAPKSVVAGEIFNVGSDDQQCTVATLASRVAAMFQDVTIHKIPDNADNRSYHLSFAKLALASGLKRFKSIEEGVIEVKNALINSVITPDDPSTITMSWYSTMLWWKKRLDELSRDGEIL